MQEGGDTPTPQKNVDIIRVSIYSATQLNWRTCSFGPRTRSKRFLDFRAFPRFLVSVGKARLTVRASLNEAKPSQDFSFFV